MSSKSGPPGHIECGIVRPVNTVMGDCLGDAGALLAARLERVIAGRYFASRPTHSPYLRHGAHHHG
ncbi:hypothetical protein [Rhizobium viscosum]|uniref:Uncharacterized protein n=1 Tax=Rhizobium viscosum TaxID=1673 RepID=A0ABR9IUB1_RHIVS|nr:hypothetical protein [Rhizobium viscosum]MBE1506784.1 hypothetical protein [Rhizobium viscosum]